MSNHIRRAAAEPRFRLAAPRAGWRFGSRTWRAGTDETNGCVVRPAALFVLATDGVDIADRLVLGARRRPDDHVKSHPKGGGGATLSAGRSARLVAVRLPRVARARSSTAAPLVHVNIFCGARPPRLAPPRPLVCVF